MSLREFRSYQHEHAANTRCKLRIFFNVLQVPLKNFLEKFKNRGWVPKMGGIS